MELPHDFSCFMIMTRSCKKCFENNFSTKTGTTEPTGNSSASFGEDDSGYENCKSPRPEPASYPEKSIR
jgi:hypothetical protein